MKPAQNKSVISLLSNKCLAPQYNVAKEKLETCDR